MFECVNIIIILSPLHLDLQHNYKLAPISHATTNLAPYRCFSCRSVFKRSSVLAVAAKRFGYLLASAEEIRSQAMGYGTLLDRTWVCFSKGRSPGSLPREARSSESLCGSIQIARADRQHNKNAPTGRLRPPKSSSLQCGNHPVNPQNNYPDDS